MNPFRARLLSATIVLFAAGDAVAAPPHVALLQEAATAAKAGDKKGALASLQAAAALRPDYPRIHVNLARFHAALGQIDAAFAALHRLAEMQVATPLEKDPALAALRDDPRYATVAATFAALASAPAIADEAAFGLADVTGIIESCAVDPETLEWYFGDVRERCVWKREVASGTATLRRFSATDDSLDGVFRVRIAPDRRTLWTSTAAVGVMRDPDVADGTRSALVAIDLADGRIRSRHPAPDDGAKHLLGDFVLARDGAIYATDSLAPIVWRLAPGAERLEPWLRHDDFLNLQGLAFSDDERFLYVADYTNGLWRIDVTDRMPQLLTPPRDASFFGLDGLAFHAGGLVAIQNGIEPQRVLRIAPADPGTPSETRIVAHGRPNMTDLALGTVLRDRLHFVGNSGWALYDPAPATAPPPRTVTILSTAVE